MKLIFTTLIASVIALSAQARIVGGEGYYRVQNYMTGRYIYVTDNKGELNFQATTAELGAIELWKNYDKTISDPATIIFVKDLDGKGRDYDLQTQGTGVHKIIDYPVSIIDNTKTPQVTHRVFGRNSGMSKYIGDGTSTPGGINNDRGYVTAQGKPNEEFNLWYFHPVTTSDDQYFGIQPEMRSGVDYYATIYAGFPFSTASQGMKAYYVSKVGRGMAALKEVKGTVPSGTPVIIRCEASTPSGNKLNIGGSANSIDDNKLKGVYFCNTSLKHKNLTPYNKETMRVLGTLDDGSVGFVTADIQYLPRNKAYLEVPAGSPAQIKLVTEDVFNQASLNSVNMADIRMRIENRILYVDGDALIEVYTVTGQLVHKGRTRKFILPAPGVYIVKAGSKVSKLLAR